MILGAFLGFENVTLGVEDFLVKMCTPLQKIIKYGKNIEKRKEKILVQICDQLISWVDSGKVPTHNIIPSLMPTNIDDV